VHTGMILVWPRLNGPAQKRVIKASRRFEILGAQKSFGSMIAVGGSPASRLQRPSAHQAVSSALTRT